MRGAIDDRLADRRCRVQRCDAASAILTLQIFLVLFTADSGETEFEPFVLRDLLGDLHHPVDAIVAAAEAARADDERHVELVAAQHHQPHVAPYAWTGEMRLRAAEVIGTCIRRATVARDDVRLERYATGEGGFHEAGTDLARCGKHPDFGHERFSPRGSVRLNHIDGLRRTRHPILLDELPNTFASMTWTANRASASRSTSIPSPGPSGTR